MDVQITERPALRVAALRHTGPYAQIGAAFGRLGGILDNVDVVAEDAGPMIAIYHDDPEAVSPDQLRSLAGVVVKEGMKLPDGLEEERVPSGKYAMTTHIGPYEELPETWRRFRKEWLPASGHRMGSGPSYELYVNDPRTTGKALLETEIYMPIVK
ncbi:MAG TPA: GyrI-like domain-containing protein [Vicinamibacterales bacterium]|nr:GyrI-like domain-containing protein [Vicinamibacterales bacterium]